MSWDLMVSLNAAVHFSAPFFFLAVLGILARGMR